MHGPTLLVDARITLTLLSALALTALADDTTGKVTNWPAGWPRALDAWKSNAREIHSGLLGLTTYEIPFERREDFESAWTHLVKLKGKGAPVVLVRGPDEGAAGTLGAGVRVHVPPPTRPGESVPPMPIAGATRIRERWLWTTYLEVVVDGRVVDLNRVPLPPETPIIDLRFSSGGETPPGSDRP